MKTIPLILFLVFVANGPEFIVEEEIVEVTINTDSSVEIWYSFTIHTTKGPQKGIYIGIPTESIYDCVASQAGKALKVEKESYRLKIWFLEEVQSGTVTELDVQFTAEGIFHPDEEGRLSLEFFPAWWENQRTDVLRVKFILPEGCPISEVETSPETDNAGMENGRAFVYFERVDVDPGYRFRYSVTFPEEYITITAEPSTVPVEPITYEDFKILIYILFIILVAVVLILMRRTQEKKIYLHDKL